MTTIAANPQWGANRARLQFQASLDRTDVLIARNPPLLSWQRLRRLVDPSKHVLAHDSCGASSRPLPTRDRHLTTPSLVRSDKILWDGFATTLGEHKDKVIQDRNRTWDPGLSQ